MLPLNALALALASLLCAGYAWWSYHRLPRECSRNEALMGLARHLLALRPPRLGITGSCGSGKSTLAKLMADVLSAHYIDNDGLLFAPGPFAKPPGKPWTLRPYEELQAAFRAAICRKGGWVGDGNGFLKYCKLDVVVWLDLPLWVQLLRLAKRTFWRWWGASVVCNGNVESLYDNLLTTESVFWYALRRALWRRRLVESRWAAWQQDLPGTQFHRLVSPAHVAAFVDALRAAALTQ